jgi:Putative transposase
VVYAKKPFAGPEQVLDYVGRYTHRVAISNNRLLARLSLLEGFSTREGALNGHRGQKVCTTRAMS